MSKEAAIWTGICLATGLSLLATEHAFGQSVPTSEESLKSQIEAQRTINAERAEVFLDSSKPVEERITAAKGIRGTLRGGQVERAKVLLRSSSEEAQLRALALKVISHTIDQDDELIDDLISLVESADTPMELRHAAAEEIAVLLISSSAMHRRQRDLQDLLHTLTRDRDDDLRAMAFMQLSTRGDDTAQELLIEGLRTPANAPLSPEQSIRFLGLNLPSDALPVLDQVLSDPPSQTARIEAIRLLGGHRPSRSKIVALLQSAEQPEAVRAAAMATLNANAPEDFPDYALPVVADESTADDIRIFGITAVQQRRDVLTTLRSEPGSAAMLRAVSGDAFDAVIRKLAQESQSAGVKAASKEYLRATGLIGN